MALDGKWEATAFAALKDPRSDEYDLTIIDELRNYNIRFAATPGFEKLRLHLFNAVLLTESGGPSSIEWTCRPMQIGNPGDPGYDVLREHQENSDIIMSCAPAVELPAEALRLRFRSGNHLRARTFRGTIKPLGHASIDRQPDEISGARHAKFRLDLAACIGNRLVADAKCVSDIGQALTVSEQTHDLEVALRQPLHQPTVRGPF